MKNDDKECLPYTENAFTRLQATMLELLAYYVLRTNLTAPSNEKVPMSLNIGEVEVFKYLVSPSQLVEPLSRVIDHYCEVIYKVCDVQGWREWAKVQSEAFGKLLQLTVQERVSQELGAIHSLAQAEATQTYVDAFLPLVYQVAGEKLASSPPPSLRKVKRLLGPAINSHYQTLSTGYIEETIRICAWLADEASDDWVRTFVSVKCGHACLTMASWIANLVELAIETAKSKEPSPLEPVEQALSSPIVEAVVELASAFQGLGGDIGAGVGRLWTAGVHPLSRKVSWEQIEHPQIEGYRLVVNERVQDALCNLLVALHKYVEKTEIATILAKGRNTWLLNSIKKSTYHSFADELRAEKNLGVEIPVTTLKAKKYGGKLENLPDDEFLDRLLFEKKLKHHDVENPVEDDMSSQIDASVSLEQMASDPSLTPRERQVLVLMTSFAKEKNRTATLEEIGQQMGLTKVRIKQLWDSACLKLQHHNPLIGP